MVGVSLKEDPIFPDTVRWGDPIMIKEDHEGIKSGDLGLVVFVDSGRYPFILVSWQKLPARVVEVQWNEQTGRWIPDLVRIERG